MTRSHERGVLKVNSITFEIMQWGTVDAEISESVAEVYANFCLSFVIMIDLEMDKAVSVHTRAQTLQMQCVLISLQCSLF